MALPPIAESVGSCQVPWYAADQLPELGARKEEAHRVRDRGIDEDPEEVVRESPSPCLQ